MPLIVAEIWPVLLPALSDYYDSTRCECGRKFSLTKSPLPRNLAINLIAILNKPNLNGPKQLQTQCQLLSILCTAGADMQNNTPIFLFRSDISGLRLHTRARSRLTYRGGNSLGQSRRYGPFNLYLDSFHKTYKGTNCSPTFCKHEPHV